MTKHLNSAKKPREEGEGRCSRAVAIMVVSQLSQKNTNDKTMTNTNDTVLPATRAVSNSVVRSRSSRAAVQIESRLGTLNSNSFPTRRRFCRLIPYFFSGNLSFLRNILPAHIIYTSFIRRWALDCCLLFSNSTVLLCTLMINSHD